MIVQKKSATDAIKTASKRAIQKIAEATGNLTGNKIADKIKSVSKYSPTELHSKELQNSKMQTPKIKKRYVSPEKRLQIIDQFRLV